MLGADIVVVEALRLFLGELQHLPSPLGKLIESICHGLSPLQSGPYIGFSRTMQKGNKHATAAFVLVRELGVRIQIFSTIYRVGGRSSVWFGICEKITSPPEPVGPGGRERIASGEAMLLLL
jgi:hypothetical protein